MSKYLSRIGFSAAARAGSVGSALLRVVIDSSATWFTKAERSVAAKAGALRTAATAVAIVRNVRRFCMVGSVRFAHLRHTVGVTRVRREHHGRRIFAIG